MDSPPTFKHKPPTALLEALWESAGDAIIGKTLDGVITSWNTGAERLYGYAAKEVIGRPISLLIPPDHPDELPAIMERLRRGEQIDHYETERIAKDGRHLRVSVTISPIKDPAGRIVGASSVARDVTDRTRLDEVLQQQAHLLDLSYDAILVHSTSGVITYWNEGAARLYGWSAAEATGKVSHALLQTRFPPLRLPMDEILSEDGHWEGELTHTRRDGMPVVVDSRQVLVRNSLGEPVAILETNRDITQRKQAETLTHYLDEASRALAQSLDYEMTLARVAGLAVPEFADWSSVDILQPDGSTRQVALAHADPARVAWVQDLSRRYPVEPDAPSGVAHVIRTGELEFYPMIPRAMLDAAAVDDERREIIEQLHLTPASASLCVREARFSARSPSFTPNRNGTTPRPMSGSRRTWRTARLSPSTTPAFTMRHKWPFTCVRNSSRPSLTTFGHR